MENAVRHHFYQGATVSADALPAIRDAVRIRLGCWIGLSGLRDRPSQTLDQYLQAIKFLVQVRAEGLLWWRAATDNDSDFLALSCARDA